MGKKSTPIRGVYVKEIACGNTHTVIIDDRNRAFSWGFGGYGRLGHSDTSTELVPRLIKFLDGPKRGIRKIVCGGNFNLAIARSLAPCTCGASTTPPRRRTCTPSPLQIYLGGMSGLLLVVPKGGCLLQMNLSLDVALVLALVNWAWENIRNRQLSPLKLPNWNMSMSSQLDAEFLTASS